MQIVTVSRVLVVLALICFVLAAFHVVFPVDIIASGLAFLTASFLVP